MPTTRRPASATPDERGDDLAGVTRRGYGDGAPGDDTVA
jgi:hypothetical protein